ncbi:hypothetical protein FOYG_17321 [Fusarium oxysporum NRRL 32931]|uniref:Uncharacterized protein n=1 Tax=Fusarium oxysporum NRRL 32931 TaxID=660029 RepID=W9HET8_FUSOX|nr:hypothetical protein FOYG_17321 [Fusarium oxysporum NRRL 32931]
MMEDQENMASESSSVVKRAVILVTCPVNASINKVLAALGSKIKRKTPAVFDWQAGIRPSITENLCYARHMAIFLTPVQVWEDEDLSFEARFSSGTFWDHRGSLSTTKIAKSGTCGAGESWSKDAIESIEAVEPLGITDLSDEQIFEEIFKSLFCNWVYLPIWWNCQDFAIRLGYMLAPTMHTRTALGSMLCNLRKEMEREVIEKRYCISRSYYMASHIGAMVSGVAAETAALSLVAAPLLPVFLASVFGTLALEMGYRWLDEERARSWVVSMSQVENQFPLLKDLHMDLFIGLTKSWKARLIHKKIAR